MMSKLGDYVINLLIAIDQLGTTLVTGCRVAFFNATNSANAMDKSYVCVSVFR